jgi:hypothetical protein
MTTPSPIRKRIWSGAADGVAKATDVGKQSRDLAAAFDGLVPFGKVSVTAYAPTVAIPVYLAVTSAPFAILCSRIRINGDLQNVSSAPQGGFAEFSFDVTGSRAKVTQLNAWNARTGNGTVNGVMYVMDFLVVY